MEDNKEITEEQAPYYVQYRSLPNGTTTLILGILSIPICGPGLILGIIAILLHKKDREIYYSNKVAYDASYKSARAGYVCAIIGVSISVFPAAFYILYAAFKLALNAASGGFS